jgi:hypothetical protein
MKGSARRLLGALGRSYEILHWPMNQNIAVA